MTHQPRPAVGVAMVLAGSVLFAVNGTVSKLAGETGIDAPQLTTLRATGAALGLFALALVLRPASLKVTRRAVPMLVVYGLAGFFLVPMLYFVAISRMPVGIGLLFEYTAPVLVALWARFVQGHAVRPRLWAGLAASLVGLACVAEVWGKLRLDGLGLAAALGAAVLLAAYYLLSARGVADRDTLSLTAYAFGVSAIAGAVVRPWWRFDPGQLTTTSEIGVQTWLLMVYIVIGGSIAPYLLLAGAMRHLPPTSVGIIGMSEPVVATAVAWLVLHEHLNAAQIAGGALILVGVALAETARVKPEPSAPSHVPPS
ncbi:EamA family transporter [Dactylosporangium fulvum]|uniref:DMT family transporter n=1 Tax=Dactylosporangium fulvum TaxID=53359 RepID=A0ABY5VV08_9ACTN|nr:DMT family transporter [Dactylosporangium fulvum]UWP81090.1 DMT family transporter [Dactylosporangium fulvum]